MATRFIPKSDFIVADKQGRRRMFKARHRRNDGSPGYLAEEIKGLYRDHLKMFREVDITGEGVEQATAAPGEKRMITHPEHECGDCGESFKTAAALGSHSRVHNGEDGE